MKSTGEAMGIGRTFQAALLKAVRGLDLGRETLTGPLLEWSDGELEAIVARPTHERLFAVCELLAPRRRSAVTIERIHELSAIDRFWLYELAELVGARAARRSGATALAAFRMVDTAAAEFPAKSPYYYLSRGEQDEMRQTPGQAVVVVGSGPIRIGQGIEFDYSCVHAAWALQAAGRSPVVVNNNPETVSTDFDISDALSSSRRARMKSRPHIVRRTRAASCSPSADRPRSILPAS